MQSFKRLFEIVVVITVLISETVNGCNEIGIGKSASLYGVPMIAYNNDWDGFQYPSVVNYNTTKIAALKNQYLPNDNHETIPGVFIYANDKAQQMVDLYEGAMNNEGVSMDFGTYMPFTETVRNHANFIDNGIGHDLWAIVIPHATSARDAWSIIDALSINPGFTDWVEGSTMIADANEIWQGYLIGGHMWAACIVSETSAVAVPNIVRIEDMILDGVNCIAASGFEEFARLAEISTRIDTQGIKHYNLTTAMNPSRHSPAQITRLAQDHLAITGNSQPTYNIFDGSVEVNWRSITFNDLQTAQQSLLSAVNNQINITASGPRHIPGEVGSPVCRTWTNYGYIMRPGNDLATNTLWIAVGAPCLSIYLPIWIGIDSIPERLSNGNEMSELFRKIQLNVDSSRKYSEFNGCNGPVDTCIDGDDYYVDAYGFSIANGFTVENNLACGDSCSSNSVYNAEELHVACAGRKICDDAGLGSDQCCKWCYQVCTPEALIEEHVFGGKKGTRRVVAEDYIVRKFSLVQKSINRLANDAEKTAKRFIRVGNINAAKTVLKLASQRATNMAMKEAQNAFSFLVNLNSQ